MKFIWYETVYSSRYTKDPAAINEFYFIFFFSGHTVSRRKYLRYSKEKVYNGTGVSVTLRISLGLTVGASR